MTCADDCNRQTDIHTDTETDKPIAIGETLQICLEIIIGAKVSSCFSCPVQEINIIYNFCGNE